MTIENQTNDQQYSVYKEIRFLINTQPENKYTLNIARVIFLIISNVLIIPFSMFAGGFNPLYFYLNALKHLLIFSLLFSFFYFAVGTLDSAKLWQNRVARKKEIFGRILHLLKESVIMLIVSSIIFVFFHLSGFPKHIAESFLEENPSLTFPLYYYPTNIELVLIIVIISLLFLTIPCIVYWFYSRCTQYTGYNVKKKILKFNLKRALFGFSINAILLSLLLTLFIDELFIATKFPGILASWSKFETVFASNAYILLVIELAFIVVLNLFYLIDGFLANKYRTNFVDLDPLATVE